MEITKYITLFTNALSATQTFSQRVYLEIAELNWKQQLYNQRKYFKDESHKNDTTIVRFAPGYSHISKAVSYAFMRNY